MITEGWNVAPKTIRITKKNLLFFINCKYANIKNASATLWVTYPMAITIIKIGIASINPKNKFPEKIQKIISETENMKAATQLTKTTPKLKKLAKLLTK